MFGTIGSCIYRVQIVSSNGDADDTDCDGPRLLENTFILHEGKKAYQEHRIRYDASTISLLPPRSALVTMAYIQIRRLADQGIRIRQSDIRVEPIYVQYLDAFKNLYARLQFSYPPDSSSALYIAVCDSCLNLFVDVL